MKNSMAVYPNALSKIDIGGVTLPNRIVRTAHVTMLGIDCRVIGDACSPRFLETAILEGRLAGMSL